MSNNNIYVITTLKIEDLDLLDWRTPAWFQTYEAAFLAIFSNDGDYHEGFYNYLVLERLSEGIYPQVITRYWYKWGPLVEGQGEPDQIWGGHGWQICSQEDAVLSLAKWDGVSLIVENIPICQIS